MSIAFETPAWDAPSCVKALTTYRQGGVSQGEYASLNLAMHAQDKPSDVQENRSLLKRALSLPAEPIWLNQVHGTVIHRVSDETVFDPTNIVEADGALTTESDHVCAILTADCLPLFLTNQQGSAVALLHAGWRGLANGIIEAGINMMTNRPQELIVWAGPCIGADHFEIGDEVRQQLGGSDACYLPSVNANKWLANLYALVGERLAVQGVRQYTHSRACTFRDSAHFFSYRRATKTQGTNPDCGRMASLIWIEE